MLNLSNVLGKPIIHSGNQTINDIKYRIYTNNSDAYPRNQQRYYTSKNAN